jgi:4-oxalmesaconate hydratase
MSACGHGCLVQVKCAEALGTISRTRAGYEQGPLEELLLKNVYFDTCVYHKPGIELLFKVIPIDNIMFASEMLGAVRGVDPNNGHYYDDTKFYIDALPLSEEDRCKIFETNARRGYRLDRTDLFKRRG